MRNILSVIILAFMVTGCMTSAPITSTQTRSEDAATSAASVPAQTSVLRRWSGYGITFEYVSKEEAFIDGQRADIIEREPGATVYQSGDKTVIHYFPQQKAYYKHGTTLVGYFK